MGHFTKTLALGAVAAATVAALAGPATAAPKPHKVGVCHRTASDSNPYVFIVVDKNSTKYQGHLAHRNNPDKWLHGRRDYIDGLDGSIKSLADCPNGGKPMPPPPHPIPPGHLGPGQTPLPGVRNLGFGGLGHGHGHGRVCRTSSIDARC